MFLPLLTAALMTFQDPAGDARGDGGYILPQRPPVTEAMLDLRTVSAQAVSGPGGRTLRFGVGLGQIGNPWQAPSGFSAAVIDIFVRTSVGGSRTLADTGLQVRGPGGWQYHLRLTGFGSSLEAAPTEPGGSPTPLAAPAVRVEGTRLVADTAIPAGNYAYWVTSSVYSPLTPAGLLKPSASRSPLALQAAREDAPTPVDVLAAPDDRLAFTAGTLAPVGQTRDRQTLTLAGLGLAGLLLTLWATVRVWRRGA
ncbi:glucodextranase DOMON-like domain-containing protein [Deinococcus hohokamensis]|uniref:Glucodextranase DOMON-like domain-containing protein n=1 Tax=Deinococcus hohokamensis TaxID=309883 RepID=A0ABV9I3V0_9DEIO